MLFDSDGDGLTDTQEARLGTHPERDDTDGDSAGDYVEQRSDRMDPTLYDVTPPKLNVEYASLRKDGIIRTNYDVGFSATDGAGIKSAKVIKDGDAYFARYPNGKTQVSYNAEFHTDVDTIIDGLNGLTVEAASTDVNENQNKQVVLQEVAFYGRIAEELQAEGFAGATVASTAGLFTGITDGAGTTSDMARAILADPVSYFKGFFQIIEIFRDLGILRDMIDALPEQVKHQQDIVNPYDKTIESQQDDYYSFATAWAIGRVVYIGVSMVAGYGAVQWFKNLATVQRMASTLAQSRVLRTAASVLRTASYIKNTPGRIATTAVIHGLSKSAFERSSPTHSQKYGRRPSKQRPLSIYRRLTNLLKRRSMMRQ